MKKFLIVLAMVFITIGSFAQSNGNILWFRTTEFAMKYVDDDGYWTDWSDWEKSNMKIKFDLEKEQIIIYSPNRQTYYLLEELDPPTDSKGKQIKFSFIDQDDDYGSFRIRKQNNGTVQFYVDFKNISWVYNVVQL